MGRSRHRCLPQQAAFLRLQLKSKQTIKPRRWHCVAGPCGRCGRTEVPEDRVSILSPFHPPQPPGSLAGTSCLAPTLLLLALPILPRCSAQLFPSGQELAGALFFLSAFPAQSQGRSGGPAPQRHRQPLSVPRRPPELPRWSWATSRSLCTALASRHRGAARRAWWGWCMASCGWCSPMACP